MADPTSIRPVEGSSLGRERPTGLSVRSSPKDLVARAVLKATASPFTVGMAWAALVRWGRLSAVLGAALAGAAVAFLWARYVPVYRGVAWIKIEANDPYLAFPQAPYRVDPFAETQLELMRSPMVLEPVAADPEIAVLPEIRGSAIPASWLRQEMRVERMGQSELYQVSLTAFDARRASQIVNAVIESYMRFNETNRNEGMKQTLQLLEQQRRERVQMLDELRGRMARLEADAGVATTATGPVQPGADPLSALKSRLADAELDRDLNKAQAQARREALKTQVQDVQAVKIEEALDQLPEVVRLKELIAARTGELARIRGVAVQGSSDPLVRAYEVEIIEQRKELERARETNRPLVAKKIASLFSNTEEAEISALERQAEKSRLLAENLKQQIAERSAAIAQAGDPSKELRAAQAELKGAEEFYQQISTKIEAIRTEMNAPSRVTVVRMADVPKVPENNQPWTKILVAAMGAFCLPFAWFVFWEYRVGRITEPGQIVLEAEIPVLGEIPFDSRRPMDRAGTAEESNLTTTSIHELCARLWVSPELSDARTLVVTSATPREGKASLAAHLAISLAQATGRPTLLVDADTVSPSLHRLGGHSVSPGWTEVLQGRANWEESVVRCSEHLDLLPAGAVGTARSWRLDLGQVESVVGGMKERYGHVVINASAVLPAGEALSLARHSDGVLISTMYNESQGPQLALAVDRLTGAGARVLGAVLCGVSARRFVSIYGTYHHTN